MDARVLATIAVVTTIAWCLGYAVVLVVTALPRILPAGSPRAPVEPAVAALLCPPNGKVPDRAAAATVLDLAARGAVRLAAGPAGQWWLYPAAVIPPGLHPHERLVFEHVDTRAGLAGGVTPATALRFDSRSASKEWHERFAGSVVTEARQRGLVRDRAPLAVRALLRLAVLVPGGFAVAAAAAAHQLWLALLVFMGCSTLALPVRVFTRPVPTRVGRAVVADLRRLRAELSRDPALAGSAQPAGEDRRPAYAMALGVGAAAPAGAATALATLSRPRSGPRDRAWSAFGGRWRQVDIVDRRGLLTGVSPSSALWSLPGALVFFPIWAVILFVLTAGMDREDLVKAWPPLLLGAGWATWAVANYYFWRFAYRAAYDLTHPPKTLVGQVVYLGSDLDPGGEVGDHFYVAIDDGSDDRLVRHEIDEELHARLRHGEWVRLDTTPKLGSVVRLDVLPGPESAKP